MRHPSSYMTVSFGKFWWTTLLAFFLQTTLLIVATSPSDESTNSKIDDLQIEEYLQKRDWNRHLNVWGKRAWSNLHGGWGLKRSIPILEQKVYSSPPIVQKRSGQNFQNGWGKRLAPEYTDIPFQETMSVLENNDDRILPFESDNDFDTHNEEKRKNWVKFSDGWGKRNKWEGFRGAWGKREPAWVNLKGLWGKRSETSSYIN